MTTDDSSSSPGAEAAIRLEIRRTLGATPERLFAAWTDPAQLVRWWGPRGTECSAAEVDLRVGGTFRLANRFADGRTLWIVGEFEVVEPPHRLVYTWRLEPGPRRLERVTVTFERTGTATEIVVVHERIPDPMSRDQHRQGWEGCLDGLAALMKETP